VLLTSQVNGATQSWIPGILLPTPGGGQLILNQFESLDPAAPVDAFDGVIVT
jgi:hypothetical protein